MAVRHRRKHSKMITGTVKFFNTDKGYGFIQPEDGSADAFVHISAVEAAGMGTLDREQRVTYDLENDKSWPHQRGEPAERLIKVTSRTAVVRQATSE